MIKTFALDLSEDLFLTSRAAINAYAAAVRHQYPNYAAKLDKVVDAMCSDYAKVNALHELTSDQLIYTARTMDAFGGSFARHIANAYIRADSGNASALLAAFPELFHRYGPKSDFYVGPRTDFVDTDGEGL